MANTDLLQLKAHYGIVGRDSQLDGVLDTALQVAPTNLSVLIQGESGVGKEVIPRLIHDNSSRKSKRYIAINCGSIPEGTIDSELFGHVKGAFTGAIGDHDGYFGAADGGTLFLDEVGELPLPTQVRLLRVLETGEYVPVGSNVPRKTDVRIVAATNVKMEQAIRDGRFREDLYYRLCTISIKIPALRDRGQDILLLFKKFALDTAAQYRIPVPLRLSPEAEQVMLAYKWPGNIRQLKNVVEQMSILSEERTITPEILATYGIKRDGDSTCVVVTDHTHGTRYEDLEQTIEVMKYAITSLKQDVELLKQHVGLDPQVVTQPLALPSLAVDYQPSTEPAYSEADYKEVAHEDFVSDEQGDLNLAQMEKKMIVEALRRTRNRRKVAAEELGISERTLYRKIKDYGLDE